MKGDISWGLMLGKLSGSTDFYKLGSLKFRKIENFGFETQKPAQIIKMAQTDKQLDNMHPKST